MSERKEHSAAFKIFNYPIECMVPAMYLYSEKYVAIFGTPTSGNREIDQQQATQLVRAAIPVSLMATCVEEGASVHFLHPEQDAPKVYGWITTHLKDWSLGFQRDINRKDAPLDDLRILESFAIYVYRIARNYLKDAPETSGLFQKLNTIGRRGMRRDAKADLPPVPAEHNPVLDAIVQTAAQRRKFYGGA